MRRVTARTILVVAAVGLVLAAACSRSPEAQKARHLERGDKYFARKEYREAVLEYQNVLRIDGANLRATERAAFAYYELGQLGRAFPYLVKSQELDPDNLDVRVKLGAIRLLARQPDQAREAANFVLAKDPRNIGALLLLAGAASTP